jgi:hypothetical protein
MISVARNNISVDTSYLRAQAQACAQLARNCANVERSHQFEAIGVDLMLKAEELDSLLGDLTPAP